MCIREAQKKTLLFPCTFSLTSSRRLTTVSRVWPASLGRHTRCSVYPVVFKQHYSVCSVKVHFLLQDWVSSGHVLVADNSCDCAGEYFRLDNIVFPCPCTDIQLSPNSFSQCDLWLVTVLREASKTNSKFKLFPKGGGGVNHKVYF